MASDASDPTASGKAIACLNVKYSPNLGDGLLSECLEAALVGAGASPETRSVDLAAREAYGDEMSGRGLAMSVLDALPTGLRHRAVRLPLALKARSSWRPHYEAGLETADAVVIGGGNLLSDLDLNFPTKLALALDVCRARGLPVAFYACGMGAAWSDEGDRRLRAALSKSTITAVFLRDTESCARWNARFADVCGQTARTVRDPGLLTCDTYARTDAPSDGQPTIGLGIMSHIAIRYHAETRLSEDDLRRWYVDLARALRERGARVKAFTNGSPEDRTALDALRTDLVEAGCDISQPATPAGLAELLARCDAICAFRMHALIGAYSLGVPALALRWDDKVDAFMASVGRSNWLHDVPGLTASAAADMLIEGAETGIPEDEVSAVVESARADVRRLYAAIVPS